jgi:hypothetical protein
MKTWYNQITLLYGISVICILVLIAGCMSSESLTVQEKWPDNFLSACLKAAANKPLSDQQNHKDYCYHWYAIWKGDSTYCEKVVKVAAVLGAGIESQKSSKDQCYNDLAYYKGDDRLCDKITNPTLMEECKVYLKERKKCDDLGKYWDRSSLKCITFEEKKANCEKSSGITFDKDLYMCVNKGAKY